MDEFKLSLVEHLAKVILMPLGLWLLSKLFSSKKDEMIVAYDASEMQKLSNKRILGCFANFFVIAILLTVLHYQIWLPLYEWSNYVDKIVLMSKPTIMQSGIIALYFSFSLSIILTKYYFSQKYGYEKACQLNSYHSVIYNLNNYKLEKWLLDISLFFSIFVSFVFFNDIAIITEKEVYYSNPFSITKSIQAIDNITTIDVFKGSIAPNGKPTSAQFYKVNFKNSDYWKVTDPEKFKIVLFLAEKRTITVENKGIEN